MYISDFDKITYISQ